MSAFVRKLQGRTPRASSRRKSSRIFPARKAAVVRPSKTKGPPRFGTLVFEQLCRDVATGFFASGKGRAGKGWLGEARASRRRRLGLDKK